MSALQNAVLFWLKQYYRKQKWRETNNRKQNVINQRKKVIKCADKCRFLGKIFREEGKTADSLTALFQLQPVQVQQQ